jgi:hypothetical protein
MHINEEIRRSVSFCRLYLGSRSYFHRYRSEKARLDALWLIRSDLRKPDASKRIKRRITGTIRNLRNLRRYSAHCNASIREQLETELTVLLSFRHI